MFPQLTGDLLSVDTLPVPTHIDTGFKFFEVWRFRADIPNGGVLRVIIKSLFTQPPAKLFSDRFGHGVVSMCCAKKISVEICPAFGVCVDNCGRCRSPAALQLLDIAVYLLLVSGIVRMLYVTGNLLVVLGLVGFG